jgi:CBS domain-containing protein
MTPRTQEKHRRLEKIVLDSCNQVIVTSPTTAKTFKSLTTTPIEVITNGFDDESIPKIKQDSSFTISHIGSLLSDRNPTVLWEAIAALATEHAAFKDALRIKLVGKVSEDVEVSIRRAGLGDHLELVGYVSHKDALRLQREARLLLLIEIDAEITRGIIPGKIFEYLAAERPILGIGPKDADVGKIISDTNSGTYCLYTDKENIKSFILNEFISPIVSNTLTNRKMISKYHRKTLTSQLSNILLK